MLTLAAANNYSGETTVAAGVLQLGNTAALGSGGLAVNGGSLDMNDLSVTVPSFSGAGGIVTTSAAVYRRLRRKYLSRSARCALHSPRSA